MGLLLREMSGTAECGRLSWLGQLYGALYYSFFTYLRKGEEREMGMKDGRVRERKGT